MAKGTIPALGAFERQGYAAPQLALFLLPQSNLKHRSEADAGSMSIIRPLSAGALLLAASLQSALSSEPTIGGRPELPAPETAIIPTINVAKAVGWPAGRVPQPAPGLAVTAYARNFSHPRWLYTLPNGDVLVAETSGARAEGKGSGVKSWFKSFAHKLVYGSIKGYFV